jgi:alpha-tubulin suppressor-like RCC1 family protein
MDLIGWLGVSLFQFSKSNSCVLLLLSESWSQNTLGVATCGNNVQQQLGLQNDRQNYPVLAPPLPSPGYPIQIVSGGYHSLILMSNGNVLGSGAGQNGQLGDGDGTPHWTARIIPFPWNAKPAQVAAGQATSYVVTTNGTVYSMGDNSYGQTGTNDTIGSLYFPQMVVGGLKIVSIGAGSDGYHVLCITSTGDVYSFGSNSAGQLGVGMNGVALTKQIYPVLVNFPWSGVPVQVRGGSLHSMVITSNGNIYAFGDNAYGQLGIGTMWSQNSPVSLNFTQYSNGSTVKTQRGFANKWNHFIMGLKQFGTIRDG